MFKNGSTSELGCFGGVFELTLRLISAPTPVKRAGRPGNLSNLAELSALQESPELGARIWLAGAGPLIAGVVTADKLIRLLIMNTTRPHNAAHAATRRHNSLSQSNEWCRWALKQPESAFSWFWNHNHEPFINIAMMSCIVRPVKQPLRYLWSLSTSPPIYGNKYYPGTKRYLKSFLEASAGPCRPRARRAHWRSGPLKSGAGPDEYPRVLATRFLKSLPVPDPKFFTTRQGRG